MDFDTFELTIPSHWLSAIINGDETSFDYYDDPADYAAYEAFCAGEIPPGAIIETADEEEFCHYHDAKPYGVLPCSVNRCTIYVPAAVTGPHGA